MVKTKLKEYSSIFWNIKPHRLKYFMALFGDCITDLSFYILTPVIMKFMIDAAVSSDIRRLKQWLLIVIALSISGMILFIFTQFFFYSTVHRTTVSVRTKLFKKILSLPMSYIEKKHSGDITSRLTNDVNAMQNSYGRPLRTTIFAILNGSSAAVLMIIFEWRASIILFAVGILSVIINSRQIKATRKINDRIQMNVGKYSENLSDILGGFFIMKNFQLEGRMSEKVNKINNEIMEKSVELAKKNSLLNGCNFFFEAVNFAGVVALAAFLSIQGISHLGSVVSLTLLVGRVNRMFGEISGQLNRQQGFLAGAGRVTELFEAQTEPGCINIPGENDKDLMIELKQLSFSYDGATNTLDKIDLRVEKGQIAALVGPSGGGKSTIIKMILGYYQPLSGYMTIGGKALKEYTVAELRELTAYVPQDAYIFDSTIKENILCGRRNATMQEIIDAARAAHADEFIQELSEGYETLVGERGIKLSGGQRQRIAIARAFLKDAPILLLDEATSALDSQSEQYIQQGLNELMKDKTVLVIAHRLSTIKNADIIYVIDSGKNIEQGKHEELVQRGNLYKKLYETQFGFNYNEIGNQTSCYI